MLFTTCNLYSITLKEMPSNRVGNWKSEYKYFYPDQTLEVTTDFSISLSKDEKQLLVGGYSKVEDLPDAAFSYYADLVPDSEGKYSYQFMSTSGMKKKGTIEVIDLYTTKMTFSEPSGYTISKYKMETETLIIGEEKTYDTAGNFLFRATYRNELLSKKSGVKKSE